MNSFLLILAGFALGAACGVLFTRMGRTSINHWHTDNWSFVFHRPNPDQMERLEKLMKSIAEDLDAVRSETTLITSLIALTTSIKTKLDAVLAGALNPEQQAGVEAIFAEVEAQKAAIAAALVANTPAETPAPEVPPADGGTPAPANT